VSGQETIGPHDRALGRWFADLNHQGIFATDGDLRVTTWNRWMEIHSGQSAAEANGRPLLELVPDLVEREIDAYYKSALAGQISVVSFGLHRYIVPLRPTHADLGLAYMPQSARIGPLWDGSDVIGTITTIEDVSDRVGSEIELRKQIEAQLLARSAAEKALRAKDDFLSTLSHEIRQPLNAVLGWTRILRDRDEVDVDLLRRALQIIDRNATVQARMIDDLLDMARIVAGKLRLDLQPLDLLSVTVAAVDVVTPAARSKRIALHTTLDPQMPRVLGDPARLQQAVWNLLSNAVKFTNPGGTIEVRVGWCDKSAHVTVTDTGRGIAAELLPYVFERFRQGDASSARREGGLGLGLALVRELVELHGGTVTAASPGLEKGATFTLELPVVTSPELSQNQAGGRLFDGPSPDLTGMRVLVVDDEADARELLVAALTHSGATVASATSCEEALALLAVAGSDRPHVIVSDIGMPREDGYELIRRLRSLPREQGGRIPAVALTGYANAEDRDRARAAGYQEHVTKPMDPYAVIAAIAKLGRTNLEPVSSRLISDL
jgi:signal transduction histidine kinase/ActR/RegA family two-component response regulator